MGNYLQRSFISQPDEIQYPNAQGQPVLQTTDVVDIATPELVVHYQNKLEHAISELEDFRAWFDILSLKCPNYQGISPECLYEIPRAKGGKDSSQGEASDQQYKMLEKEIATLKHEYEKLSLNISSGVSTLRDEIKIIAWNQYNEKVANFTNQLQTKDDVLNKAYEKITSLESRLEQMQSSISEKDSLVYGYKLQINSMGCEAHRKDEMISKCSKELELLKSQKSIEIPISKRRLAEPSPCSSKEKSIQKGDSSDLEALRAKLVKHETDLMYKNVNMSLLKQELRLLKSKKAGNISDLGRCSKGKSVWDGHDGDISDKEVGPSYAQVNAKSKAAGKMPVGFCLSERGFERSVEQSDSEDGGNKGLKRKADNVIGLEVTSKIHKPSHKTLKLKSAFRR